MKIQNWHYEIGLTTNKMRQLLWWACIGISNATGGKYEETAPFVVQYLAEELKYRLSCKPRFQDSKKNYKESKS